MLTVYLVPIGRERFELYSEVPDEPAAPPDEASGWWRRWTHTAAVRWHELLDVSRRGTSTGRFAKWRDRAVCHLAESLAEQRTLWALRGVDRATMLFPSTLDESRARAVLDRSLASARRHHGRWLAVDLVLLILSAVLMFVPGPNIVAYYLAFRVIGHLQSWRGAGHGIRVTRWTLEPDANLTDLASLVDVPRETRASRVAAIASRLNLPRLSAFFDRAAVGPA